jgi:hypothetical protein
MNRCLRLVLAAVPLCLAAPGLAADGKDNKFPDNVRTALDKADALEVYSLDPSERNAKDGFHGWKVLGKTTLKDQAKRKELLEALDRGMAESTGGARCFIPRHGVRAVYGAVRVDLVICFECGWVYVYDGDKDGPHLTTSGKPQPVFDKVLRDANVPLPKD